MSRIVPRLLTLWLSSLLPIFAADAQQMTTLVPNAVMSNAHLDFNDDGNADIFWRDNATGDNSVWLLDGGEVVGTISLPTMSPMQGTTLFRTHLLPDVPSELTVVSPK